ncbi:unnamed protein product [Chrysoparadoxa australica]
MTELLKSYYGMQTPIQQRDNTLDIDSSGFLVDEYVRRLLRDEEVEKLLRRDENMVQEVRKLDSDMQMLVYENYNKFISATDTIRKMQRNMESMEAEMDGLQCSMGQISDSSNAINKSFQKKRGRVDKLVRAKRQLERLEFLLELPQYLQHKLEEGDLGEAIKYWRQTDGMLQQQTHIESLRNIHRESADIMEGLKEDLLQQVKGWKDMPQLEIVRLVGYLLLLGVPAEGAPWDTFCSWHAQEVEGWFEVAAARVAACKAAEGQGEEDKSKEVLALMKECMAILQSRVKAQRQLFPTMKLDASRELERLCSLLMDLEPTDAALLDDMQAAADEVHETVPELELEDRIARFVHEVNVREVQRLFTALKARTVAYLKELADTAMDETKADHLEAVRSSYKRQTGYQVLLETAIGKLLTMIEGTLVAGKALQNQAVIINRTSWGYIAWLVVACEAMVGMPSAEHLPLLGDGSGSSSSSSTKAMEGLLEELFVRDEVPVEQVSGERTQRALLLLACLCHQATSTLVPKVAELLVRHVPVRGKVEGLEPYAFSKISKGGDKLLELYVERIGSRLASWLHLERDLLDCPAPTGAQEVVESWLDEIDQVQREAAVFLGESKVAMRVVENKGRGGGGGGEQRDFRRTSSTVGRKPSLAKGLQMDIDRIFASCDVTVFGQVKFSGDSILAGVMRAAFKALAEQCRHCTLGQHSYQQLQVDIEILHQVIPYYISDSRAQTTLDDLLSLTNIGGRLPDFSQAMPLDPPMLNQMVSQCLSRFGA